MKQWCEKLVIVSSILILLGTAGVVSAQSVVKIGFVPSESFAPLFVCPRAMSF